MANLKNGSTGSDVKKLQEALIDAGYDVGKTGADGVFGKNTLAAVKQYQKDNGLSVDGIAGKNTLGSLYATGSSSGGSSSGGNTKPTTPTTGTGAGGSNKPAGNNDGANKPTTPSAGDPAPPANPPANPTTSPGGFTYGDFSYAQWNPMDDPLIQEANTLLQNHMSNKVGDWVDPYKDKWMGYMNQYENRDPFSYDFNSDALYNQYKDQYIQQGRMAMMDTMGQAQAMTGGYGNSYAQTVGQQAYNQQLNQLNEVMPELYGMAYDRYSQEGQDMLNMYSLYKGMSEQDYNMHQDNLNNWYTQLNYLTDNYNTTYNRGYDDYLLGYNSAWDEYLTDRSEAHSEWQTQESQKFTAGENDKDREAREKENAKSYLIDLITGTGYEPTASELAAAGISKEQANAYKKAYTGDTGTGNPGNTDNKYKDIEIGSTAYNTINAEIKNVTTIAQLKSLVKKWIAMGYDPAVIDQLTADKAAELMPKPDPVLDTGSTRVGVSGGGSGVTFHATAW